MGVPSEGNARESIVRDNDPEVISNFYVYLHKNPASGEVFYVGKGRGKRAYQTGSRNNEWEQVVAASDGKFDVEFVEVDLLEDEACDLEAETISKYGQRWNNTGPLVNQSLGGRNEMGGPVLTVSIPGMAEAWEAYECRLLQGKERDSFADAVLKYLESYDSELRNVFGNDDEESDDYFELDFMINPALEVAKQFRKRRESCKSIGFQLSELIEDMHSFLEDEDFQKSRGRVLARRILTEIPKLYETIKLDQ